MSVGKGDVMVTGAQAYSVLTSKRGKKNRTKSHPFRAGEASVKRKEKNDDDISDFPSYEAGSHKNQAKSRAVLILHLIGQDLNSFVVIGLNGSALACSQKYTYQSMTYTECQRKGKELTKLSPSSLQ